MGQLGKYELVAEVARGTLGIVYLAAPRSRVRREGLVALKQLKPDLLEIPGLLPAFLEEAALAAKLDHPNIVKTHEVGSDEGRHFVVMDWVEGVTLARIFRRRSPKLSLVMHLQVIREVLRGLAYAHALKDEKDGTPLGIVHRDATPENVLVTYEGVVKLVDFGLAKAIDSSVEANTAAGGLKAKPWYMAPEQIGGDVDVRTDVFSAGVMIWEAVARRRMWQKKSDVEVVTDLMTGNLPSLAEAAPDADPDLLRIVGRAVTKSMDDRYAAVAELIGELDAWLELHGDGAGTLADVGALVGELFAAERVTVNETIDEHIGAIDRGRPRGDLPSLRDLAASASDRSPLAPEAKEPPTPPTKPKTPAPAKAASLAVAAAPPARTGTWIIAIVGLLVIGGLAFAMMSR